MEKEELKLNCLEEDNGIELPELKNRHLTAEYRLLLFVELAGVRRIISSILKSLM